MNLIVRSSKQAFIAVLASVLGYASVQAQTYTWTGGANTQFYNTSNWSSTQGAVAFDNSAFKIVRTNATGQSPTINQWVDWQPGIFDQLAGNLTLNANFQVYFNDFLNGDVTINSGASFICRNIFRVGREGTGTVNINGGTMQCLHESNWQGIFIGALSGGNGTVNVNNGGLISGGYQVEVGTRDFYPTGTLNVNAGGTSEAYWTTVVGPNGTLNVNGGTVNTGQAFIIGDLYLDNAANTGTLHEVVGTVNLNSGTITVNHFDLEAPFLGMHANSKFTIDNGTLRVKRTGVDFTSTINGYIANGQIAPVAGKQLQVTYDGTYTTVTASPVNSTISLDRKLTTIYPTVTTDYITVIGNNITENSEISVINIAGSTVLNQKIGSTVNNQINVSNLAAGLYIARINNTNGVDAIKFIKK